MAIGGGLKAIRSVLHYSAQIGPLRLWQTLHSKNACKACAFGTGGQNGGLHNEARKGIEICNKNIQAHLSDARPAIANTLFLQRSIAELSQLSGQELEALGRLTTPLYKAAGDPHFSPMRYEDAIALCTRRLQDTQPERTFFYASGRSSNEAAYLLQLMARLYGTNNVNNCSYYCHQASGVALHETLGTGTATIEYADLDHADLVFVFGANPASNHPRFVKKLLELRRKGAQVVVVNPAKEPGMVRFASPSDWRSMMRGGEAVASVYVQPHCGGDQAFITGVAKAVLEAQNQDDAFIDRYTAGFADFAHQVREQDWAELEERSGVDRATMVSVAKIYGAAHNAIFTWSMGLTHHTHGVATLQTLVGLALMRGMIGRQGAGLMPLRGHSNIQGTGSMGFTPALKAAIEQRLEAKLGAALPTAPGLDTMACMHASAQGDMDAAVLLGGNLLASNPDTKTATESLNRIPFKCFLNSTLNLSHVHGVDQEVLVLPVRARDEEKQGTTQESMFNYVRLSDGGIQRHAQLWSEVEIITALGQALIPPQRLDFALFADHNRIRQWIAETIPGFQKLAAIGQSKEEFHIDGRILHEPAFATPDGLAHFRFHPLPEPLKGQFRLSSVRSEGQFNSIIYHGFDSYRGQTERHVLLMNPEDIRAQGLQPDQKVNVESATGRLTALKVRPFDVRRGNVLTYYPEANALIPQNVDPHSRTPSFKSVAVAIAPTSG